MIGQIEEAIGSNVSRETFELLEAYVNLLIAEAGSHNLIARSTLGDIWERHVLDSAQLLQHVPAGPWLDIGSGAGLPGMVVAILSDREVTLNEPRRLRAEFLRGCTEALGLQQRVTVATGSASTLTGRFDVISARAVAAIDRLFAMAHHLSHSSTVWVLPKGRGGNKELAQARQGWQGRFHTRPSITDPEAVIVVAAGVTPRGSA